MTLCLGIETSCDETAAAVVEGGATVRSDVVASQIDLHQRFGGVVPEIASRNHLMQILPVVDAALARASVCLSDIGAVAVTAGPGLQGALLVGVQVGKALCAAGGMPLVAVNHLEGHLWAQNLGAEHVAAPFIALIVSGGHTALYEVRGFREYRRLGATRDDAAGEAFDKVARLLGRPYPGGKEIEALARGGDPVAFRFPRALARVDDLDFSFSGLKTAVALEVQRRQPRGQELQDFCASFQEAVVDSLVSKLFAAARVSQTRSLVICGGVAANGRLRAAAAARARAEGCQLVVPAPAHCTDNGAMIAAAGHLAWKAGVISSMAVTADANWKLERIAS